MHRSRFALIACTSLAALLCGGCYGFSVSTSVTPLSGGAFAAHSRPVNILFGAPARRPHVQVAHIEVVGTRGMSTGELMSKMEQEARGMGADAVVSASQDYKRRSAGNVFFDILMIVGCVASKEPCHNHDTRYEAPVLRGVAVKYVERPPRMVARRREATRRAALPAQTKKPPVARVVASSPRAPVVAFGRVASMSAVPGPAVTASLTTHLIRRLKGEGVSVAIVGGRKPDKTVAASIQQAGGQCMLRVSLYDNRERRVTRKLEQQGACTEQALRAALDSMTGRLALRPAASTKKSAEPDEPWAAKRAATPVAKLKDHPRAPF